MGWSVTWTSWSGVVGTATVDTEADANVLTVCLSACGISQVAKWNPDAQCVWANGVRDATREEKGCTHPADEPCFPLARALAETRAEVSNEAATRPEDTPTQP